MTPITLSKRDIQIRIIGALWGLLIASLVTHAHPAVQSVILIMVVFCEYMQHRDDNKKLVNKQDTRMKEYEFMRSDRDV